MSAPLLRVAASTSASGIRPRRKWIRTRVRNDDSIVLELALGNVSLILPGDIGPAVERVLAAQHGDLVCCRDRWRLHARASRR